MPPDGQSSSRGYEVSGDQAWALIKRVGINHVIVHPAQDHITLNDGRLLKLDEGGYDHGRSWLLLDRESWIAFKGEHGTQADLTRDGD